MAAAPPRKKASIPAGTWRQGGRRGSSPVAVLRRRMVAARLLDRSIFIRELLPQDMKIEVKRLTEDEAKNVAAIWRWYWEKRMFAKCTRKEWLKDLQRNRSKRSMPLPGYGPVL